jgi:pyruvate kinase
MPEALENMDKIVAYCDALMVARGDLGVELPAHEVPRIKKELICKAKMARISYCSNANDGNHDH